MPTLRRIAAALAVLALAAPAAAGAQSPFTPLPPPTPEPVPAPQVDTGTDDDGLSTAQTLLVLGAAGSLLAGIAFFVVRDARGRAPVQERDGRVVRDDADSRQRTSEEHRKAKARNRAAAKRARQARKKNVKRR